MVQFYGGWWDRNYGRFIETLRTNWFVFPPLSWSCHVHCMHAPLPLAWQDIAGPTWFLRAYINCLNLWDKIRHIAVNAKHSLPKAMWPWWISDDFPCLVWRLCGAYGLEPRTGRLGGNLIISLHVIPLGFQPYWSHLIWSKHCFLLVPYCHLW